LRASASLAAALCALTGCGDHGVSSTTLAPDTTVAVTPVGFDLDEVTIRRADGDVREMTVWVADTVEERGRGLMDVTDLGDGDGMLFVFEQEGLPRFYMWQTPMPLDIAYFAADGSFVDAATMEPCLDPPVASCDRYPPSAPALLALELPAGAVDDLEIGPGTTLTLT
jgi:uncharacterized membrane protein (UPF0127 family)